MKFVANGLGSSQSGTIGFAGNRALMTCGQAKELLSPYLDGAVTGTEMQSLQRHMEQCSACMGEFSALRATQQLLANVPRVKAPPDLGLKLRLAISREAAEERRPRFEGLRLRMENTLHAFMVPATAGLACAVLIFGLIAAVLATPGQLQANNQDVPLVLNTGPELLPSTFGDNLSSVGADALVIEAYVDRNGRVQDYKILSDPAEAKQLLPQVKRMLIFTTFRPAMSMGYPIPSRAVLSFSRISVRG